MPCFTPWPANDPLDPHERTEALMEQVLRPNLRRAFPLPASEQGEDQHFRFLLDSLAYVSKSQPQGRDSHPSR